jgi:hypothetical protein
VVFVHFTGLLTRMTGNGRPYHRPATALMTA